MRFDIPRAVRCIITGEYTSSTIRLVLTPKRENVASDTTCNNNLTADNSVLVHCLSFRCSLLATFLHGLLCIHPVIKTVSWHPKTTRATRVGLLGWSKFSCFCQCKH